jgi:hypothetical protein
MVTSEILDSALLHTRTAYDQVTALIERTHPLDPIKQDLQDARDGLRKSIRYLSLSLGPPHPPVPGQRRLKLILHRP